MLLDPKFHQAMHYALTKTLTPYELLDETTKKKMIPTYARKNLLGRVVSPQIHTREERIFADAFLQEQKYKWKD